MVCDSSSSPKRHPDTWSRYSRNRLMRQFQGRRITLAWLHTWAVCHVQGDAVVRWAAGWLTVSASSLLTVVVGVRIVRS